MSEERVTDETITPYEYVCVLCHHSNSKRREPA